MGKPICEVVDDACFSQRRKMLGIDPDLFQHGSWAEWLASLICGVTDIGHPRCDINETDDLGIISGLGDDSTAPMNVRRE